MIPDALTTRRHFLREGLTLVGAGATVPAFLERSALAANRPDERILVVVQMAGGNDGLNTVVPYRRDPYYKSRPTLAVAADKVLKINDEFGFHPAAEGLKNLYDDGLLALVQGVGYPNPNRSHFKSTDIWATASPDGREYRGWIGRYFDNACSGAAPCPPDRAVALTEEAPLALAGEKFQGVALNARLSARDIRKASKGDPDVRYPQAPLAQSLRTVGRMIAANMPTRVYYVSLGGFDTHSGQINRHRQCLQQVAGSLRAFVSDLKQQGNLDRVLIMTFSEFGRRVSENASGGTDHGTAAPMFLIGTRIQAGIHGKHPDLEDLDRGDLKFTLDFRRIYADVLSNWMRADASRILGQQHKPLKLICA